MISKLIALCPVFALALSTMALSAPTALAHPPTEQDEVSSQCKSPSDGDSDKKVPAEFAETLEKLGLWRESLTSLHVVYHWTDPQTHRLRHLPESRSLPVHRTEMKWQDWWVNTNNQLMKSDTWITNSLTSTTRLVTGRTNHHQYYAEYSKAQGSPRLLTAADLGAKKTLQNAEQMPLYPIYFAINGWFSAAFERLPAEYYGTRMIGGSRCVGISLEGSSRPIMWLDVEHDGLPRMIEPAGNVTRWGWICDEFRQADNGRWFPAKGRFGYVDQEYATFEVESFQMNAEIPLSDFDVPTVSKGTYVRDMTANGVPLHVVDDFYDYSHASTAAWWQSPLLLTMVLGGLGAILLRMMKASGMIPCPVPNRSQRGQNPDQHPVRR